MSIPIIYLRSSFEPGGIESLLIDIFNHKQKDFVFHFVLLKNGSQISQLNSKTNTYYNYFRKSKFDVSVIYKLAKLVRKKNVSLIHTHQPIELFYAVLVKLLIPRIRIYHTIHGYIHTKWKVEFEKFLLRFSYKVLTVSNATLNHYLALGYPSKNFEVLYNAVKQDYTLFESIKHDFNKAINYTSKDKIIGMIGNFVWWKDQLTIIKAFKKIVNQFPDLKLVFIGFDDTPEGVLAKSEASEYLGSRIFFLSRFPHASSCLSVFNGFVFSSLADTFGIVMVEAMLNNVPVLASDIEVCRELSMEEHYFDLFKTGNIDDLAEKITKLINEPQNTKRLNEARNYCMRNFSMEAYFIRLNEIYK